jgi:predicted nucleic acid-binding protein
VNRGERRRHLFAAELLSRLARRVIVPWPVYVEVDLLLRGRGHERAADALGRALLDGVHSLVGLTDSELETALDLGAKHAGLGLDLPDLSVMAISKSRRALVLSWDFRHFRAASPARGRYWPLLVQEHELPAP